MNITWNADRYAKGFSFVPRYGQQVAELIDAPQGTSVLDLGCGSGALTHYLADKGYRVSGIDASPEQIALAKKSYPTLSFAQGDAAAFELTKPVDVVFSNAVLHWLDARQQPGAIDCVFRALKPGGQFVLEMGGAGNNALIHAALDTAFARRGCPYRMPFYFPSVGEYAALLEQRGFVVRYAALIDRPTRLDGPDGLADWIEMFLKAPLAALPEAERRPAIEEAVEQLRPTLFHEDAWYADYVRLRIKAIRP